jgi:hypothetical protein
MTIIDDLLIVTWDTTGRLKSQSLGHSDNLIMNKVSEHLCKMVIWRQKAGYFGYEQYDNMV